MFREKNNEKVTNKQGENRDDFNQKRTEPLISEIYFKFYIVIDVTFEVYRQAW